MECTFQAHMQVYNYRILLELQEMLQDSLFLGERG